MPEKYGGSESGIFPLIFALEQLASHGGGNNQIVLTTAATMALALGGEGPLQENLLPQLAAGKLKFCLAVTEPEAGFNILRARTSAVRQDNHYRVNGSKIYISGADKADYMLLLARTKSIEQCSAEGLPKTFGVSLLVVDARDPAIQRRPVRAHGDGGLVPFELSFNDVRVPADHCVGPEHAAAMLMFAAFNPERILFAAQALGMSQYCLDRACAHASQRRVFKDPIGAYQSIQHPLAEVKIRQQAVRWATYRAAWSFERQDDPIEVSIHANGAKLLASELATKSVDAAIDAFGGKGFDEDYGIIHLLPQARLMKTSPISNALILNAIAEHVLALPRSY